MCQLLHKVILVSLAAITVVAGDIKETSASFIFTSSSAVFDPTTSIVDFTITFNQPPILSLATRWAELPMDFSSSS
jgi:hypothetical protein